MCYAIPGKLVSRSGDRGKVAYFGEEREVRVFDSDVSVGDYVIAQGGILINRIPADEALDILMTWSDLFGKIKAKDTETAVLPDLSAFPRVEKAYRKAASGGELAKSEIIDLLEIDNPKEAQVLYQSANCLRHTRHGNACCVHGILEFSNWCKRSCAYCGINAGSAVERYRLDPGAIFAAAENAVKNLGFKAIVIQSGEDDQYTIEVLSEIVTRLRRLGILVFLSIGVRPVETYAALFQAGARAALLRFETVNERLFNRFRPGTLLEQRLKLIQELKEMGYVLATGFLFGLPGETLDDMAENILLTKSLQPEMISFGPFLPVKGTALAGEKGPSISAVLRTIAILRLVDPASNIVVTTAMETLDSDARKKGLACGGNSLMINLTPQRYQPLYRIYDNRAGIGIDAGKQVVETVRLLIQLGRSPMDIGIVRSNLPGQDE